jgi:hypothetical protein
MLATGVAVSVSEPLPYKLNDDAPVLDWLHLMACNILKEAEIKHDAESLKDLCSLRWCLMSKAGRMRARKLEEFDTFKERMRELVGRILSTVQGRSSDELDANLVKDITSALLRDIHTGPLMETRNAAAAPPSRQARAPRGTPTRGQSQSRDRSYAGASTGQTSAAAGFAWHKT